LASKLCSRRNFTKPIYEFNHKSNSTDGFCCICKVCCVEQVKQWHNNNRSKANERERNRYATNQQHKVSKNMHNRLMNTLRRGIYSARTEQIIGLNMTTF